MTDEATTPSTSPASPSSLRYDGAGRLLVTGKRCDYSRLIVTLCRNKSEWLTPLGWRRDSRSVALACDNTPEGLVIVLPKSDDPLLEPGDTVELICQELGFKGTLSLPKTPVVETPAPAPATAPAAVKPPEVKPPEVKAPAKAIAPAPVAKPELKTAPEIETTPAPKIAPKVDPNADSWPAPEIEAAAPVTKPVDTPPVAASPQIKVAPKSAPVAAPIAAQAAEAGGRSKALLLAAVPLLALVGVGGWWLSQGDDEPVTRVAEVTRPDVAPAVETPAPEVRMTETVAGIPIADVRDVEDAEEAEVEEAVVADDSEAPAPGAREIIEDMSAGERETEEAAPEPEPEPEPEPDPEPVETRPAATRPAVTPPAPSVRATAPERPARRGRLSERDIRTLQEDLGVMGYLRGPATGELDSQTQSALVLYKQVFEVDSGRALNAAFLKDISESRKTFEAEKAAETAAEEARIAEAERAAERAREAALADARAREEAAAAAATPAPATAPAASAPAASTPSVSAPSVSAPAAAAPSSIGYEALRAQNGVLPDYVERYNPDYPRRAAESSKTPEQVRVRIRFDIDTSGQPGNVSIVNVDYDGRFKSSYEREARDAILKSRFSPASLNGQTLSVTGIESTLIFAK